MPAMKVGKEEEEKREEGYFPTELLSTPSLFCSRFVIGKNPCSVNVPSCSIFDGQSTSCITETNVFLVLRSSYAEHVVVYVWPGSEPGRCPSLSDSESRDGEQPVGEEAKEQRLKLYDRQEYIVDIVLLRRADEFSLSPLITLWIQGK
ncbi:hypothetical protein INR49_003110 [Caranx melampygus]|nr:hypothetical protein INR49_003110 [Caranx melampygus]